MPAEVSAPLISSDEPAPPGRCRKAIGPLILVFTMGAGILVCAVYQTQITHLMNSFLDWCMRLGLSAAVLIVICTALLNLLMLPTFPMMVGASALFTKMYGTQAGAALGTVAVFGGLWLGSVAAFLLGRSCLREMARRELEEHPIFQVINGMIDAEGTPVVLLSRMSPLLPAEVFNYACSVTSLTPYQYAVGCLGSIVPVGFWSITAAQATSAATRAGKPSGDSTAVIVINVVVMALLTFMLYSAYSQYKAKAEKVVDEELRPPNQELRRTLTRDLCHVNYRLRPAGRAETSHIVRSWTRSSLSSHGLNHLDPPITPERLPGSF